jgi:outer membrane receptor protein involved in Fe transport
LGLAPDFQSTSEAFTRAVFSGGNANLEEERADTVTFGVILTPSFLEGFSLTLDYWDIENNDAINSFPAQAVANGCVDAANISNPLCASITRGTDGNITTVSSQLINIASFEASGIDVEARYLWDLNSGDTVDFSLIGTYLDKLDFFAQEGQGAPDSEAGELGDPELQFNLRATYTRNNLDVSLEQRFFSSMDFDLGESAELRSPRDTGDQWYTDVQLRYSVGDSLQLFVGINNLFDNEPPAIALVPETRAFGDDAIIYDQIGRYLYAGVRYDLF